MSEYDILEQHDPMPLLDMLYKVRAGCSMHMNRLDNDGYCAESDEYAVVLAFFDDYIEKMKEGEGEGEAMREGEWSYENDLAPNKSFPIGNDAEFGTNME